MSGIFITGCGTDIGKTIVTAAVLMSAKKFGVDATVFKPVQTGCTIIDAPDGKQEHTIPDLKMIADICASSAQEKDEIQKHYSYSYIPACSPHLAANMAKERDISISKIFCDIKEVENDYDLIIMESAGGLMVPLNNYETFRDLAVMLQYETILVSDNRLGCINETLLTIEALTSKELPPLGIIMNNTTPPSEEDSFIRRDNPKIISTYSGVPVITELEYAEDISTKNLEFWDKTASALTPIVEHALATKRI